MRAGMVVGNPKPASRTRDAAELLLRGLGEEPCFELDLALVASELVSRSSEQLDEAVRGVQQLDLLVVASPTYKATYTGLLKLFLERFDAHTGLQGIVAVPMMLGGSDHHYLAPEVHLKPVLVELGAICPTEALYLLDQPEAAEVKRTEWLARWSDVVHAFAGRKED
jgi:FMN reductase